MKTHNLIICLSLVVVLLGGCRKKPDSNDTPQPEASVSGSDVGIHVPDRASDAAQSVAQAATELRNQPIQKTFDVAGQFQVDQDSNIPEITAKAKQMAVENLRKMAEQYRDAITQQQQKLHALTEKFIAIDDAEKNTPEADKLKATIDEIYKHLPVLKERFHVYYDALKEKAGNLTGLNI